MSCNICLFVIILYIQLLFHQSNCRQETVWYDDMNSDNGLWGVVFNAGAYFNYNSDGCFDGTCALTRTTSGRKQAGIYRGANITKYSSLQLQFDLCGYNTEVIDTCDVYAAYDSVSNKTLIHSFTFPDTDSVPIYHYVGNQTINISLPVSGTFLWIFLEIKNNDLSGNWNDQCYWDNIHLKGTLSLTPSETKKPTNTEAHTAAVTTTDYTISTTETTTDYTATYHTRFRTTSIMNEADDTSTSKYISKPNTTFFSNDISSSISPSWYSSTLETLIFGFANSTLKHHTNNNYHNNALFVYIAVIVSSAIAITIILIIMCYLYKYIVQRRNSKRQQNMIDIKGAQKSKMKAKQIHTKGANVELEAMKQDKIALGIISTRRGNECDGITQKYDDEGVVNNNDGMKYTVEGSTEQKHKNMNSMRCNAANNEEFVTQRIAVAIITDGVELNVDDIYHHGAADT